MKILQNKFIISDKDTFNTKCRGDRSAYPQETRRKYAGPFAGIVTLAHLTDWEFLSPGALLLVLDFARIFFSPVRTFSRPH